MAVFPSQKLLILPFRLIWKTAENVSLSSLGRSEHNSLEILSGNIGLTLSGKYTDVALL